MEIDKFTNDDVSTLISRFSFVISPCLGQKYFYHKPVLNIILHETWEHSPHANEALIPAKDNELQSFHHYRYWFLVTLF